jgi:hypothetical protein
LAVFFVFRAFLAGFTAGSVMAPVAIAASSARSKSSGKSESFCDPRFFEVLGFSGDLNSFDMNHLSGVVTSDLK